MNPYGTSGPSRSAFVLAAIGGWAAAAYWAALTFLIFTGVAAGAVSPVQIILPAILIALYAYRGWETFRGNPSAASGLMWLHILGAGLTIVQLVMGISFWPTVQVIKIVVHVFGAVTAFLARRG